MRAGVSTYTFARSIVAGKMDVDGLLAWAREHGATAVQFCENLPWPFERPVPEGLVIETGCRGIGDHLIAHLRFAQSSGCGFVRLVIDDGADEPTLEGAVERLRPFVRSYREAGVTLGIENHDRFRARELRDLVIELGSDAVGIVLDTANSLGRLEGLEEVADVLGPYVVNLHAKDVRAVRKRDMLGFDIEGAILGRGAVDLPLVLTKLPRLQSVTLEQWVPAGEGAVEREIEWAETSFRYLNEAMGR